MIIFNIRRCFFCCLWACFSYMQPLLGSEPLVNFTAPPPPYNSHENLAESNSLPVTATTNTNVLTTESSKTDINNVVKPQSHNISIPPYMANTSAYNTANNQTNMLPSYNEAIAQNNRHPLYYQTIYVPNRKISNDGQIIAVICCIGVVVTITIVIIVVGIVIYFDDEEFDTDLTLSTLTPTPIIFNFNN